MRLKKIFLALFVSFSFLVCWRTNDSRQPLLQVLHVQDTYSRRADDFTVNVTGLLSPGTQAARYRINDSDWFPIRQDQLRVPEPFFTIELFADQLKKGANVLHIAAGSESALPDTTVSLQFNYDPQPVSLSQIQNWDSPELDVYDGHWERVPQSNGTWRVRPKPGFEGYDRILIVCGAFAGGRRIETDVTFRHRVGSKPYGFGILSLWGGSPDDPGVAPRRGWNFGLAWYYSMGAGLGLFYSYKHGDDHPQSLSTYQEFRPQKNQRYHLIVEAWPEESESGMVRFRQRMKWWNHESPESPKWIELADSKRILSPGDEFAVALLAHRCQVEFGPVFVSPLEPEN
ncbi:hypothetical protein GWO43_12425 [candidate division KSB1 bacterium]|nr:hypothetical protein [candidate division KSB1 bacterium]NIR71058.1 hypothetical protein [candidate division KSB1 bacterium]NIS24762.1 hypothetical protein [candidate division KSB1 bacterium]NIT71667.1 hypothetical protein [candidate division KSB1 bacterium]NIU25374.1 hypothetical protein [candidate division KSB1 bacterium]